MYVFSKEGELIQDLSSLDRIPGSMTSGVAFAQEETIYAGGSRIDWDGEESALLFDGLKWKFL